MFLKLTFILYATAAIAFEDFSLDFPKPPNYVRSPFGDAVDRASVKLLKAAIESAKGENVVSSPLGVQLLLSLYAAGAPGALREEVISALGSSNYSQLYDSYRSLSSRFNAMDRSYLTFAEKVYIASGKELDSKFLDVAKSYHSQVESISFADRAAAADIINKWASDNTQGNIKKAISKDDLDENMAAALCNVIFFKGHWHVPFRAEKTVDRDFHVDKQTVVKKPMMRLNQPFYYYNSEKLGARLVELPYKEKGFRMVVVLPNEIDGIPSVIAKVSEHGLLEDVFSLTPGVDIDLEIPKFEINSGLDLNDLLPKVGISKLFSLPATGIVKDSSVVVSKAIQKAFIKVDEEGATAGAFTGFMMVFAMASGPPHRPIQFHVDRPFLFAILHEDVIIFLGTYVK